MSGPTLVIELAEPLSPAALREFRALIVGLSSEEKRPGFFDVNVPAERLGVEDRREEDWRWSSSPGRSAAEVADLERSPGCLLMRRERIGRPSGLAKAVGWRYGTTPTRGHPTGP
ncbi:DUF6368 family protein [Streptomyces yangpuensis]|uniref:DUF6368 family protein n=1 Tax=Streptomyces yangpuensis TaxID=1648182 RepID=UPI003641B8E3